MPVFREKPARPRSFARGSGVLQISPFTTIQDHFYAWRDGGVFERMLDALRTLARAQAGRSPAPTAAATGSQSARRRRRAGPAGTTPAGRPGPEAPPGGGRRGVPDRGAGARGGRAGPGRGAGRDPGDAGKAPQVRKLRADGGCAGPKPGAALARHGLGPVIEIVQRPKETRDFTVPCRRWVVERTFAWLSWCRRPGRRTWSGRWRARWPGCGSRRAGSWSGGWRGAKRLETNNIMISLTYDSASESSRALVLTSCQDDGKQVLHD